LIDLLYFNKPVGGIKNAEAVLKQFVIEKKCDTKKLVEYAARFPNIKTRKRMGLILEEADLADALLLTSATRHQNTVRFCSILCVG
jgi:predicted transcriptional regulator of viral defense system